MKLTMRLGLGFGSLVVLVALVGGVALWQMHNLSELNRKMFAHPFTVKSAVLSIDADVIRLYRDMKDILLAETAAEREDLWKQVEVLEGRIDARFEIIRDRFLGEPQMYLRAMALFDDSKGIRRDVMGMILRGDRAGAEEIMKNEGDRQTIQIISAMNALQNFAQNKAEQFSVESTQYREWSFQVMYLILGVTLLAGILAAWLISLSITRPAREIADVSRKIADGDLSAAITYRGADEVGQMAESLRRMLSGVIGEGQSVKRGLMGPVWMADAGLVLTYLNQEAGDLARDLTGREPEDILGRMRVDEVFADRDGMLAGMAQKVLKGEGRKEAEIVLALEGREVHLHERVSRLLNLNGEIRGIMGVGTDITGRKLMEAERAILEEQLRQSQKMESIGTLAGGVAHDFNNILSAILGYTELILEDLPEGSPLREYEEQVMQSTLRARNLVAQLLAFSRKQMLHLKSFPVNDVVTRIHSLLQPIIGEDVDLELRLNPEAGCVLADFNQLEQVVMNLISNSRLAMPGGGRIVVETDRVILDEDYVALHAEAQTGPHVMLSVSDTGVGMDEETLRHIFEPFFTTREVGQGTGLGLSMVYGVVRQMGGNIYTYSEPGRGTVIKLYLPVSEKQTRDTAAPPPAPADPGRGDETILLAEDDEMVRNFISLALRRQGYRVLEAADGRQALELVRERGGDLDLLITDVVMPTLGGRELAEEMGASHPGLKVLFISGYSPGMVNHPGMGNPGGHFLQKPISSQVLMAKVREMLEGGPGGGTPV